MSETKKNYRIWQAVKDGPATMVTPEAAFLIGSKNNFIAAHKDGLSIVGKGITFGTSGEQIRQGGLFVNMNDFVRMIPSTISTPIPPQMPMPPMGMVASIMKDLPFFMAMVAGAAAGGS